MNRGIARRTIFESEVDIRMFLSGLALAVRAGRIEVHAYCVLSTHFHLLVRSPCGELSAAMQSVQNEYARWFNRSRRRDGPLFRSGFRSKPIDSLAYREQLVRYIDANSVLAGLVRNPSEYPHSSAWWFAQLRGPVWLSRVWIESVVCDATGSAVYAPRLYVRVFGDSASSGLAGVIEKRIERSKIDPDPFDDLLNAAPERVLAWMQQKARNADGTNIGQPVCDVQTVIVLIAQERTKRPVWRLRTSRRMSDAWSQIEIALLRDLCGAAWSQIGALASLTDKGACKAYDRHRRILCVNSEYATVSSALAKQSLDRCHS